LSKGDPYYSSQKLGDELAAQLGGRWTAGRSVLVEAEIDALAAEAAEVRRVTLDLSAIERMDTLGAWVLNRLRHEMGQKGISADFSRARPEQHILLNEIAYRGFQKRPLPRKSTFIDYLADIGFSVAMAWRDLVGGVGFLGAVVVAISKVAINPFRFRSAALVHHMEQIAFRGLPIIALISFLVGGIVAQQGIFQLQRFGATPFVVDLVGILVLRELAVLLTSIMVAGRSGSAFTAEIGSMKMREEIDALRVMGLNPIEVLVVPRVLALILCLPLLTFMAMMAALFGGGLVAWFYGDISPEVFLSRLQQAIALNTFLVGIIKAPFMALVIGLIACTEGMSVQGSAESLGRQVTASVVKAIFMVIVVDGIFAMFFAAIRY
jgi:phospholipid/cholesterol/gamma-HCH transport system permease protein